MCTEPFRICSRRQNACEKCSGAGARDLQRRIVIYPRIQRGRILIQLIKLFVERMDLFVQAENVINILFVGILVCEHPSHLRLLYTSPSLEKRVLYIPVFFNDFKRLLRSVQLRLYSADLLTVFVNGGIICPDFLRKLTGLVGQFHCSEVHELIHQLLFFSVKANYCNSLHFNY